MLAEYVDGHSVLGRPAEQSQKVWQQTASRWLGKRRLVGASGTPAKRQKIHRKKSLQWLSVLDHMLHLTVGQGLLRYQAKDGEPVSLDLPFLSVSSDSGSDAWAGHYFAQYKLRLNLSFSPDPSHQWWRDVQNSWSALGWGTWIRLLTVVYNLMHGPWEDGSRFFQLQASSAEFFAQQDPSLCPLVDHYLQELIEDLGCEGSAHDGNILSIVWEQMQSHWGNYRRGSKVAMCRFGAFLDASADHKSGWCLMLIRLIYYGMSEGMFDELSLSDALPKNIKQAGTVTQRGAVKRGDEATASIRAFCKNNLHLAVVLLSDMLGRSRVRMMVHVIAPRKKWYSEQSCLLRSTHGARAWFIDQLRGGGHPHTSTRDLGYVAIARRLAGERRRHTGLGLQCLLVDGPPDSAGRLGGRRAVGGLFLDAHCREVQAADVADL